MHPALAALAAPFDRIDETEAAELLEQHYGIAGAVERVPTERDDTFRVRASGGDVVLKLAHPLDGADLIDLQVRALQHARRDPDLPLQSIVPTRAGALVAAWNGRLARVFEWMPGRPARGLAPTPRQLQAAGRLLGRLNLALADFEHPAARRQLPWDLEQVPLLRELATGPATEIVDRFESTVLPRLRDLPHQVVHNDFHPGNLLVDDEQTIVGILDFGDTVHTARVNDLGVALAYLSTGSSPWEAARPMIAGFDEVVGLLPEEHALLPHLVAGRLAQRVLLNAMLERDASANSHRGGL